MSDEATASVEDETAQFRTAATALADRFILARMLGMTHEGKRDVYGVLGYDVTITADQYRERYNRGGIAGRVVDALPNAVWRGEGEVFEDEDPKTQTTFENEWAALNEQHDVWSMLGRLHINASLGSFAGLLIGGLGDLDTPLPAGVPGGLLYLRAYGGGVVDPRTPRGAAQGAGSEIVVSTWEQDTKNVRFGFPLTYQLRRTNVTTPGQERQVHWTRIIHVPALGFLDNGVYGPPALEGVWNYLLDMDKVVGGGSEAFWLRANAGMQIDVDKKMALADAKNTLTELQTQVERYEHQLTRIMRTRGVNINQLGSDVADFKGPMDALVTLIAGTCGIPKRILTGSELGQLASSQDRDNWNDQVKDCRDAYAHPIILRPFIERLIEYGYLSKPKQWEPLWPDVASMSEEEKLATAEKATKLNAQGEIVITGKEIREVYLGREPLSEDELIVEPWRADLALKMAETNKTQGAVVFTDDEIRKTCYGWKPLTPEQKIPLTAPERVSATAPTPEIDAQGNPIVPAAPVPGAPKPPVPVAAEAHEDDDEYLDPEQRQIEQLEAALASGAPVNITITRR